MSSAQRLFPGCEPSILLSLAARRILAAAFALERTSTQVPALGALVGLANRAMTLTKAEEQDFFNTFNSLANLFGLNVPASDLFLLSLAMEMDERIYNAALNLTGTMFGSPGPRIGSWLSVLYPNSNERSEAFSALLNGAPLTRYKLVRILGPESAPLSQRELCGEPALLHHILPGPTPGLPEALIGLAELVLPNHQSELGADLLPAKLWQMLAMLTQTQAPRRVMYLHPLPSRAAAPLAQIIANRFNRPLIVMDYKTVEEDMEAPIAVTLRECHLRYGIPLFLNILNTGDEEPNPRRLQKVAQRWRRALALEHSVVLFATEGEETNEVQLLEQVGMEMYSCALEDMNLNQRRQVFANALRQAAQPVAEGRPAEITVAKDISVERLATTYRVGIGDADAIVKQAVNLARLRSQPGTIAEIQADDLWQAARERTRRDLGKFARRIETRYEWEDLVLPEDVREMLTDFYVAALNRARVYDDWGYGRKHVRGRGLTALFSGESGTGKTMSAEVLARSLNVDLYQVDLAAVVSKWIGETERNLSQIFDATEGSDSILFFDEADSLFGKRTEVKDSKDRYANMEVSYLLQRVEAYDGIVILASNLRSSIDTAFLRRFQFGITFPKPDAGGRLDIWRRAFPPEVPRLQIDYRGLAEKYEELSGGQIRMIAIGASLLAAGENSAVTMEHIFRSYANEMSKMQRLWNIHEQGG